MIDDGPQKSLALVTLENVLDVAEKLYAIQHQALTQFFTNLTETKPPIVKFTPMGSYQSFRPDMTLGEVFEMAQLCLGADVTGPTVLISTSVDSYMANLARKVYEHSSGHPLENMDVTWYRLDMIGTIVGIDPKDCLGFSAFKKLFDQTEQIRVPWAPTDNTSQAQFYDMIKGLKMFFEDFELAIQAKYPNLRLEGVQ